MDASEEHPITDTSPQEGDKRCTKCGVAKSESEFYRDAQKSCGRRPDCKTCSNGRVKAWLKNNRLRINRWRAEYRAKNDHKYAETRKAWRERNIERRRNFTRKYRASIASDATLTVDEWLGRIEEFDSCCAYCLKKLAPDEITLDHFRPVSRGGKHELENVVPACGSCNYRKNDSLIFDWVPRGIGVVTHDARSRRVG